LREICINHDSSGLEPELARDSVLGISLQEASPGSWIGSADLTIHAGEIRALTFPLFFRDSGTVKMVSSEVKVGDTPCFASRVDVALPTQHQEIGAPYFWWYNGLGRIRKKRVSDNAGPATTVLPKPPKMSISVTSLPMYYTDEKVSLDIVLFNGEAEETECMLELRLLGQNRQSLKYSWASDDTKTQGLEGDEKPASALLEDLPGHQIGHLGVAAKQVETININAPSEPSIYALEVKALYHLISDKETPISKIFTVELEFVSPFEASYDFSPRVHTEPWPAFFELEDGASSENIGDGAYGIAQNWLFTSKIASFAEDHITVEDVDLILNNVHGGAKCKITKQQAVSEDVTLAPKELHSRDFLLSTRKHNLEERRSSALEMSLAIRWHRTAPAPSIRNELSANVQSITSTLPIPRLLLPTSEPRVLCAASPSDPTNDLPNLITLTYFLENPTLHFLTFELTMESADDFAFSGPKLQALSLLPMSRKIISYIICPLVKDTWISPNLLVVDTYFKKTLKVLAAEGCVASTGEKKGITIWAGT
jgi:trafficking protein particle complex subunit 11